MVKVKEERQPILMIGSVKQVFDKEITILTTQQGYVHSPRGCHASPLIFSKNNSSGGVGGGGNDK